MRRWLLLLVVAALVLAGPLMAAHAQPATPSVGLNASPTTVLYGKSVTFSGKIRPPSGGQTVDIVDQDAHTLASATTKADGAYQVSAPPHHNVTVHAQWTGASSSPVRLHVKPRLSAQHGPIRLFGTTTVTGRVVPSWAGKSVAVMAARSGGTVDRVVAKIGHAGRFTAHLPIDHTGSQRVVVAFHSTTFARTAWRPHQLSSAKGRRAMLRARLMAAVSTCWWGEHVPVSLRGRIFPRSETNWPSRRVSLKSMTSIFSVQNLQTFLRRKYYLRPGPPGPSRLPERS